MWGIISFAFWKMRIPRSTAQLSEETEERKIGDTWKEIVYIGGTCKNCGSGDIIAVRIYERKRVKPYPSEPDYEIVKDVVISEERKCGQCGSTNFEPIQRDACFIATAAYGSLAQELNILRSFRDRRMTGLVGKVLVNIYYFISPPIAKVLSQTLTGRRIVREVLNPIVRFLT